MPFRLLDEEPEKLETELPPKEPTKVGRFRLVEEEEVVQPTPTLKTGQKIPFIPWQPKQKPVGLFEGISNAARNAFASSQQALAVTGGVTPEEAQEIAKIEYEKNARQVSTDYKAYQEAEGWDAVMAFVTNPVEVTTNIVAEGLAGSLPSLGAGLAVGAGGAAVGSVVPGVGTAAGFVGGQVAGTFAGSLATEYGSKVLEELQNEGMDLTNPQSITEFFSNQQLVDAAKDKALKRGVPVAAFDAVSAGIGGKVGKILGTAFKTKPREAAAEMAVQAALGGGGEVAGSLVAGDKIDPKAVFAEVVGEVGPGAAEIGVGKIQQSFAERRKQEKIKQAAQTAEKLEQNDAPLTANALKSTVAKNIVEDERETISQTEEELRKEAEKFAPPAEVITREELKTQYATLTDEELADTETMFREDLESEDAETRSFAQNALNVIADVRAEKAAPPVTPAPTVAPEAKVVPAPAAVEPAIVPVEPVIATETQVYESLGDGRFRSETPPTENAINVSEFRVSGEKPYWIFRLPETKVTPPAVVEPTAVALAPPVEPAPAPAEAEIAASLSRVVDNTATDEEVVRLARQGLVNIQDGQNIITPRGEEVMQRGGAPLPRLTPEERAAEVAAAPAIVEQAPQVAEPPAVTPAPAAEVEPIESAIEVARKTNFAAATTRQEAGEMGRNIASQDPTLPLLPPPQFDVLESISSLQARRPYNPDVLTEDAINEARDSGFITGKQVGKLKLTESGRNQLKEWSDQARDRDFAESALRDEIADIAVSQWDAANDPESAAAKAAMPTPPAAPITPPPAAEAPAPEVAPAATAEAAPAKTRLDIILDEVEKTGSEVSVEVPEKNRTREGVDRMIKAAKDRGLDAFFEGRFAVFRPPIRETAPTTPTTPTSPEAAPVGIAVGNRVKTKTTPQSFVVEEVLPQSAREAELGEQYYSIRNERTGETQVVEAGDIRVIKGKGGRQMAAATAVNIRVEEDATVVPEADRYTFDEAGIRAIEFFNGVAPDGLVIVNDSVDPEYRFKASYDPNTGDITLNRAFIRKGESIEDILSHELGHYIFSDPKFQAAFQRFWNEMSDVEKANADKIINQFYNKQSGAVQMEEKKVRAFMALVEEARLLPRWKQILNAIKQWLNDKFGTNFNVTDRGALSVLAVAHKRFRKGEVIVREMNEGSLRTAAEEMSKVDRDYLAAVERGDMETAQRMVDEAAKRSVQKNPRLLESVGQILTKEEFDEASSKITKLPRDVFYVGDIEVIRNPTDSDRRRLTSEVRSEFGRDVSGDPATRFTNDKFGNTWIWKAHQGMHSKMEPLIQRKENVSLNQNNQKVERSEIVRNAVRSGVYISEATRKEFQSRYGEFYKESSSDPVTYDDAGNVIPLSQRFQPTQRDIRMMAVEPAPEAEAAPAERAKRRTKMQNIIDISTGVKRPRTKLTVDEMAALKDQIRIGARKRRADKQTQKEFAKDVTQYLREMAIRGKVSAPQLRAITGKAMQTQFDNEASILSFINYANKVVENANYNRDISDAKAAIRSAKRLAKQKGLAGNIKANLEKLANIDPRQIEPEEMVEVDGEMPVSVAEFTAVLKEYMKAAGPVTAEGYILVPDAEITDFLEKVGVQVEENRKANENFGFEGELAEIADKTPEEIDAELARNEERRKRIEEKVNKLAEEAQIGLVKYENPEITSEEKLVLDDMKRITLSDISIGERKEFVKVANNILVNNKFLGAQKFASIARGQIGAAEAAKDSKTVKRNSATLKFYNVFGEDFGKLINLGTQSFADTFRNLTGTKELPRLLYQMGFGEIERGQANTNRARREITDGVQNRFRQIEKETGQKIADTQGVYSMGVAGNLIQIHPDETEAEGIQRMRGLIQSDIEKKKKSPKSDDRRAAIYIQKALDEVYSDTVEGVLENLKRLHPANHKALTFLMNEVLPEYKPMLKEHDELFNNQTENYENPYYLPIRYRSIGAEPKKPGELRGRATDSVTAPKQAPNSIKRIKNTVLPEGKQLDYNLTRNVLDSLSTQLEAAYTNPGWQQVYAFLKSPEAVEALGGVENYDFVTRRINNLSDSRERRIYQMDPFNQAADFVANMVRKIGTSIALGGVGQAAKQMPDQIATTIANVNDLSITTPAFTEIKAALPAMRQFSIGERGEIAGGSKWVNQLEGNFTKLQQFMQDGLWPKAMEAFENINNFWLIPLKMSDTVAASHGWISYYKKYLKDNNIHFTNWDNEAELIANGERGRVEAGLYADQMIDLYQGSSDPTKMATFAQRGDSGGGNLLKTMIMPFSSFVIQQRSRILSDLRDVSYGDTDEKKVAAKGLAGTLLGIVIFHGVRRYALPLLTGGVAAGAYGLLGVDMEEPDEEEKAEKEKRVFRQFLGEVAANIFVGGYSAYAETRLIDAVNAASYFYEIQTGSENVLDDDGEIMSWEKYRKERAPMYRYTGPGADSTLGMIDILPSQTRETFDRLKDLSDDEIMDSLTEEEQRVLILAALSETLYTMRLNDADVARMIKRMAKDVRDQAEARQKAERQLQRLYGL